MTSTQAVAIVTPEERAEREREGAQLVVQANTFLIASAETYAEAATWLRDVIVPLKRRITETFRPRIQQAHQLHKGLCDDERRFLAPVEGAERVLKGKLTTWDEAQAHQRREAEAAAQRERERLEQAARRQAEAEQRRLQAEAETRRLEEASALEARGDGAAAVRLLEAPIPVPLVVAAPVFMPAPAPAPAPKVEGISFREDYDFEILDAAVIPREYLMPDEKKIRGVVRAMRASTNIPGVRAFSRRVASVRAG